MKKNVTDYYCGNTWITWGAMIGDGSKSLQPLGQKMHQNAPETKIVVVVIDFHVQSTTYL
tara:strand:- start:1206 stop:1385 length:180 start_codon:yes stop_codon:yes gene_type:complete